jgi:hypothetical protein
MVDEQKIKMVKINQLQENQSNIAKKLQHLIAEETKVNFGDLKKKYKKDWQANRLTIQKDSGLKITALS